MTTTSVSILWTISAGLLLAATTTTTASTLPLPTTTSYETYSAQSFQEPALNDFQAMQRENCNYLCGGCGCRGFYCGDECICQCNRADDSNVKCIQHMKNKCRQSAYPFEVLIQGPAGRRFVREAKDIDPEALADFEENQRSGRSVLSIYKPEKIGKGELMAVAEHSDPEVGAAPAVAALSVLERAKLARIKLEALRPVPGLSAADFRARFSKIGGGLLGAPADHVGAPAPEDHVVAAPAPDPVVGAPAPAHPDPVVAAPAPAHEDPVVAAPAPAAHEDPVVAAAAPEDPTVGSPLAGALALGKVFKAIPRIALPPATWSTDLFKGIKLGSPIVGAPFPLIVQPEHTL